MDTYKGGASLNLNSLYVSSPDAVPFTFLYIVYRTQRNVKETRDTIRFDTI